jgi:hypothetical protein
MDRRQGSRGWKVTDPAAKLPLVPPELAPFLPYPALNQAQAEVVPEILGHDKNLLVVAPTGAGKTVMGMTAALRAVVQQGRKAAWLVPQRSLADEFDRELATWRARGLKVERLSGEYATDMTRIKDADMWVATTEKFEALCRTAALRETLAEVRVLRNSGGCTPSPTTGAAQHRRAAQGRRLPRLRTAADRRPGGRTPADAHGARQDDRAAHGAGGGEQLARGPKGSKNSHDPPMVSAMPGR